MTQFSTRFSIVLPVLVLMNHSAVAQIMPENTLWLEDSLERNANMTEQEFEALSKTVIDFYTPLAKIHGGDLLVINNWKDATVNAYAEQQGVQWTVQMFGGLARRKEITADGFQLVVCHEVGHHLAGFPMSGTVWFANEGQSDYFATETCAKAIWANDLEINAGFRTTAPEIVRKACDRSYSLEAEQNLCYRSAMGGQSLATLLAALGYNGAPQFEKPDPKVVKVTNHEHPRAQCRLDTYLNGALCNKTLDLNGKIPGKETPAGGASLEAEQESQASSCYTYASDSFASRPRCWFAPRVGI